MKKPPEDIPESDSGHFRMTKEKAKENKKKLVETLFYPLRERLREAFSSTL